MPFDVDLMHPNKTRSRSVQLDQAAASVTIAPTSPLPAIATRSSSLAHRGENRRPVFRSMLDVGSAPKIAPLKALDLGELHVHREVMPLSECQAPGILHCSPDMIYLGTCVATVTRKTPKLTQLLILASNGAPVDSPPEIPSGKPASPVDQSAFESLEPSSNAPVTALSGGVIENKNIVRRKLTGYVGFANLPNQWHRKSVRKGFNFNVMVVGECFQLFAHSASPVANNRFR